MKIAVVIGTFGDIKEWAPLVQRASRSVTAQTRPADCVSWIHAATLQEARNVAAAGADSCDWFIFLDADDELDPLYIESMEAAAIQGSVDIIQPSTLGVYPDGHEDVEPVLIPERDLSTGNYLVIGSMCKASMFFNVGGFDDYPMLEDWALWLKLRNCGARIGKAPAAVYRVAVRANSRNTDEAVHGQVYQQIRARFT